MRKRPPLAYKRDLNEQVDYSQTAQLLFQQINKLRQKKSELSLPLQISDFLNQQSEMRRLLWSQGLTKAARDLVVKLGGMGIIVNATQNGSHISTVMQKYTSNFASIQVSEFFLYDSKLQMSKLIIKLFQQQEYLQIFNQNLTVCGIAAGPHSTEKHFIVIVLADKFFEQIQTIDDSALEMSKPSTSFVPTPTGYNLLKSNSTEDIKLLGKLIHFLEKKKWKSLDLLKNFKETESAINLQDQFSKPQLAEILRKLGIYQEEQIKKIVQVIIPNEFISNQIFEQKMINYKLRINKKQQIHILITKMRNFLQEVKCLNLQEAFQYFNSFSNKFQKSSVSKEDVKQGLQNLNFFVPYHEWNLLFAAFDIQEDGKISYDSFIEVLCKQSGFPKFQSVQKSYSNRNSLTPSIMLDNVSSYDYLTRPPSTSTQLTAQSSRPSTAPFQKPQSNSVSPNFQQIQSRLQQKIGSSAIKSPLLTYETIQTQATEQNRIEEISQLLISNSSRQSRPMTPQYFKQKQGIARVINQCQIFTGPGQQHEVLAEVMKGTVINVINQSADNI